MDLIQNTPHMWLIAGVTLVVFEFVLMPGIGFLFAGLGALLVGGLVDLNLLHTQAIEWIVFFGATIIFAVSLWKPLSNFRLHKTEHEFSDMAGTKAVLLTDIAPGQTGQAKWSGTIMNTQLVDPAASAVIGTEVTIIKVEKNVLFVK